MSSSYSIVAYYRCWSIETQQSVSNVETSELFVSLSSICSIAFANSNIPRWVHLYFIHLILLQFTQWIIKDSRSVRKRTNVDCVRLSWHSKLWIFYPMRWITPPSFLYSFTSIHFLSFRSECFSSTRKIDIAVGELMPECLAPLAAFHLWRTIIIYNSVVCNSVSYSLFKQCHKFSIQNISHYKQFS